MSKYLHTIVLILVCIAIVGCVAYIAFAPTVNGQIVYTLPQ